jgi:predicted nuclease of predicted toxin-antitoxin system
MRPLDFPLLADENIHFEVIAALAAKGRQVTSVHAERLAGREDREILHYAHVRGWVVLTHDSDFGTLAIRKGEPYTGIIYLRPGHIVPAFVLEILEAMESLPLHTVPPFLAVAERRGRVVRVRVRSAAEGSPPSS